MIPSITEELDLKKWKLTGERHYLWRGAIHGGVFVEGPSLGVRREDGTQFDPSRVIVEDAHPMPLKANHFLGS